MTATRVGVVILLALVLLIGCTGKASVKLPETERDIVGSITEIRATAEGSTRIMVQVDHETPRLGSTVEVAVNGQTQVAAARGKKSAPAAVTDL